MWTWIGIGWIVSMAVVLLGLAVLSRIAARDGSSLFEGSIWFGAGLTVVLLVIAPLSAAAIILASGYMGVCVLWNRFSDYRFEVRRNFKLDEPSHITSYFAKRRKRFDERLKDDDPGKWNKTRTLASPDAMILEIVISVHRLRQSGLVDRQAFERLDIYRSEFGTVCAPLPVSLEDYIRRRLRIEEPGYLKLSPQFIDSQIRLCEEYAARYLERDERKRWPPREWWGDSLTIPEIERNGAGAYDLHFDASTRTASVERLKLPHRSLMRLKLLMLPGDELRYFSSPGEHWSEMRGRRGVVLIHEGRPVTHVITGMN